MSTPTPNEMRLAAITVLELTKGFAPEQRKAMGNTLTSLEEMAGYVQILAFRAEGAREDAIAFGAWLRDLKPQELCTVHGPTGTGIFLLTTEELYNKYKRQPKPDNQP